MVRAREGLARVVPWLGRRRSAAPGWRIAVPFLLPALLLYTMFIVYPLFSALQYSLFSWSGTTQNAFVGLANFRDLFTREPIAGDLVNAFKHNVVFFAGTMLVQNTLGLLFAVLLDRKPWGHRLFQTIYTMPYLLAPLVVGYLWTLILNPLYGPVNILLEAIGLDSLAIAWFGDPTTALPMVILVNAWQWLGFPMLLFGSGLAAIPEQYGQAARVDGASTWQAFSRITLPLLIPVIGTVTILTFIGTFNVFGLIYAIGGSQGGPAGATDVLGLLFYRTAFQGGINAIGVASALAVLMFFGIFGVSLLATRYLRRAEARLS